MMTKKSFSVSGIEFVYKLFFAGRLGSLCCATIHSVTTGASDGMMVVLYLIGGVSCLVAFYVVSAFYQGSIYRLISLPLVLTSFTVFGLWPATSHTLYGWFFDLF